MCYLVTSLVLNIRKQRFEPRFKIIRNEKNFNTELFLTDVSRLPFAALYAVDFPKTTGHLVFNHLFLSCLTAHAPFIKQRGTRPPALWLKDLDVNSEKCKKNVLRTIAQRTNREFYLFEYRESRNAVKKLIIRTMYDSFKRALSSKRPKEVWNTKHRILNPNPERISVDPDDINIFFNRTASRLLGSIPKPESLLREKIDNLPDTINN